LIRSLNFPGPNPRCRPGQIPRSSQARSEHFSFLREIIDHIRVVDNHVHWRIGIDLVQLAGTGVVIARAGIGVAVRAGAPIPDISSTDAFKRSMLAAKSVAYSRAGASGLNAAKLMERLGIADEMKSKTKLVDGVPVAEVVAKGEAKIGMQQINVILPVAGIHYVGPLPPELQDYVVFSAGVLAVSKQREAAIAMVKFMSAPEASPLIRKSGMEPTPH
jgi:molybdate transport system substrate-binding protein